MTAFADETRLVELTRNEIWGGCTVHEEDPIVRERHDVYYLPFAYAGHWGVFDRENRIVPSTIDYWLPDHLPMAQILESNISPSDVTETLPRGPAYIYGGRYTDHFGHYIIETLSRLWYFAEEGLQPGQKLVMHGLGAPEHWFRHDYVREVLGALNIGPEDIVHSERPFWIEHLIIPRPAFGAQEFVHQAFRRLCRNLGQKLLAGYEP